MSNYKEAFEKSYNQGRIETRKEIESIKAGQGISNEFSYKLAKPVVYTSLLLAIGTFVYTWYIYQINFFLALLIGFGGWAVSLIALGLLVVAALSIFRLGKPSQKQVSTDGPHISRTDSHTEAESNAQMIDLATIGAWYMEKRARDYAGWSAVMLADSDIQNVLGMNASGNEHSYLWKIYTLSNALLEGAYFFKGGIRDYEIWCDALLAELDDQTRNDVMPYLKDMYRFAEEMESSIGSGLDNKPLSSEPDDIPYDTSKFTVKMISKNGTDYFEYDSLEEAGIKMRLLVEEMRGSGDILRTLSLIPPVM